METTIPVFSIDGTDINVQDVLSKLKFLSKIKKGEKLNVTSLTISEDTFFTNIQRYFHVLESRDKTLEFIKRVSDDALNIALKCLQSRDSFHHNIGRIVISNLREIKGGIDNLGSTYGEDRMFVAKIETFQTLLDVKIMDLEEKSREARKQQT